MALSVHRDHIKNSVAVDLASGRQPVAGVAAAAMEAIEQVMTRQRFSTPPRSIATNFPAHSALPLARKTEPEDGLVYRVFIWVHARSRVAPQDLSESAMTGDLIEENEGAFTRGGENVRLSVAIHVFSLNLRSHP